MSIILNEREYVAGLLRDCSLGVKPVDTLERVARYYRGEGYKDYEIHLMLEDFMLKCDPKINIVKWQGVIDSKVRISDKYPLIEIDSIPVTQKEINICESLHSGRMERLMFTLICIAKFYNTVNENNNGWVNEPDKEIFKMANVFVPTVKQSLMLHDLRERKMIHFSRKVNNINIKVQCIDQAGDPVLNITDYRNLGNQYMRYHGGSFLECASCGCVIKRTSNAQKYCRECAVIVNRQKNHNSRKQNDSLNDTQF